MGAVFVNALPFYVGEDCFFAIDARFGQDLTTRRDDEALAPELDPVVTGRRFVADPVDGRDKATVGDGVAALHCFPGRVLRVAVLRLLGGMPADRSWIKKNLGAS